MPRDSSHRPSDAKPDPAPAVTSRAVCPNCGHAPAVVFPALTDGKEGGARKLVCLLCCPKRTPDS